MVLPTNPSKKGGHVITQEDGDLLKSKDEQAECPATEGASAARNSELLVNLASQFLDGIHEGCLSALPMPLLPGAPSLNITMPEPLYPLPSVTAENLTGGCTEHPGYQFDLQRMRQLGFPEELLQSLRFGVRFDFTSVAITCLRGPHKQQNRQYMMIFYVFMIWGNNSITGLWCRPFVCGKPTWIGTQTREG